MSYSSAALAKRIPSGLNIRRGANDRAWLDDAFATGPAWPIWAWASAPPVWIASVSRRRPSTASGTRRMQPESVRPSGAIARYATVVIAAPPAATRAWNSMRSSVTTPSGDLPSNVAALITRLRRVSGPSRAGSNSFDEPSTPVESTLGAASDGLGMGVPLSAVESTGFVGCQSWVSVPRRGTRQRDVRVGRRSRPRPCPAPPLPDGGADRRRRRRG